MTRETDCAAAMRQLWDFLDAELTTDRMSAIQAHLERCSSCYPEYNFQKIFLEDAPTQWGIGLSFGL